jgi:glutaredoxin
MIALTLFTRPGCHLCDDMKAVIRRVTRDRDIAISLDEVDISTDPDLESRYGLEIPVLIVDGKKVAKYRVTDRELALMLQARSGGSGGSGGSRR